MTKVLIWLIKNVAPILVSVGIVVVGYYAINKLTVEYPDSRISYCPGQNGCSDIIVYIQNTGKVPDNLTITVQTKLPITSEDYILYGPNVQAIWGAIPNLPTDIPDIDFVTLSIQDFPPGANCTIIKIINNELARVDAISHYTGDLPTFVDPLHQTHSLEN